MAWLPCSSTTVEPARSDIERWAGGGIIRSSVATRYQLGFFRHAGSLIVPLKASTPHGTCELAMKAPDRDYVESRIVAPGREVVTAKAGAATLGLSVCYDLRFPELYRLLAMRGAEVLAVPAAFTLQTGKDHWE